MKKIAGIVLLLVLLGVYPVFATTYYVSEINKFTVTGSDMDGIKVTASFSGGGSEDAYWKTTGPGAGGAIGTGWSLVESGDTFSGSGSDGTWTLTADKGTTLSGITIDGFPGKTVFDMDDDSYPSGSKGTPGSESGRSFVTTSTLGLNVTYSDLVALTGKSPEGDLYRGLGITFVNGGLSGASFSYRSDTDNFTPIPEPATMLLLGTGLLGIWVYARRRFKR